MRFVFRYFLLHTLFVLVNPVNPSPNKSTALNFNHLCLILFPPFLLVIYHFIYLFIVNVSMLLLGFLPLNANGWRYEIVGDCGLLSCPVTPNLMRGRKLAQPPKPQCFIPRVMWRFSFFYLSILLIYKILQNMFRHT